MTTVLGALGVAAAWGLGFAASHVLSHLSLSQRIGHAYGLGLVWITAVMGGVALVGLPLTWPIAGTLAVVPPIGWILWQIRWPRERRAETQPAASVQCISRDPWWWSLLVLLSVVLTIVAARAVVKPVRFWDAWAAYAFKAKVMYLEETIPRAMFKFAVAPNYPVGISLQEVWISWFIGSWDDVGIKWLFPAYLFALLFLVYGSLRERWSGRAAMIGTLFVSGLPFLLQHGQDGYTDLPFAYFALGSSVALTRYVVGRDFRDRLLASVLSAGLVFIREDGVILVACYAAVLGLWSARRVGVAVRQAVRDVSPYLLAPVVVWGTWTLAKLSMGIPSSLHGEGMAAITSLDRWLRIIKMFFSAFFLGGNWLILWPLFLLACVYRWRSLFLSESLFLFWPVIAYLASIGMLFASTDLFLFLEDQTVLNRMILHVAPMAALWVALVFGRWYGLESRPIETAPQCQEWWLTSRRP